MATQQQAPITAQPTSHPQPAYQHQAPQNDDLNEWIGRINGTLKDHSHITAPSGTAPWHTSFFDCFNPIDTCLMTYCCPCVTFGKTHHRLRHGDVSSWSPLNASCLVFQAFACFGCHCIPALMQRSEIRNRGQPPLQGEFVTDLLKSWCLNCCNLVQLDKEAEYLVKNEAGMVMQEPGKAAGMSYPA